MPSLRFPLFLLLLALTACSDTPPVDPADTVFVNGNVITIDDAKPAAEAVAVRDGRIKRGELLLFEAFGAGFTWGSALVRY